ncbi:MAG TPA: ABC transporter substrate-binding protein [bacterium]|nr:ABC transporter substrate-binding protein [bacterium]
MRSCPRRARKVILLKPIDAGSAFAGARDHAGVGDLRNARAVSIRAGGPAALITCGRQPMTVLANQSERRETKLRGVRSSAACIVAGSLLGALAPAGVGAQGAATLTVAQRAAVAGLDPADPSIDLGYPAAYEAASLVYDGLVGFSHDMNITSELAMSWRVDRDGRTWTFKIRRGVSFQDGTPLTAQAVAADLKREVNPKTNPSNRPLWDPIASVSAPDASTVQIVTAKPYGALLNTLAHGSALIASPAAVEKWGAQYKLHPVGTGPYAVDRWDVGTQLELIRTSQFWDGVPGFGRIVLRNVQDPTARVAMLQSGQAQVAEGIPPENVDELRRVSSIRVVVAPALRTFGMGINLTRPVLQDLRVRQALNYAVSKDLLVKALFRGYARVLDSPVAPQAAGSTDVGPWPYDPPRARRLLDAAGWKPAPPIGIRVKDGKSLEITLLTPRGVFPQDVEVVETLADYLRNVGFGPHFIYVEPAAFRDNLLAPPDQYKWDLAFFGFNPSNGDGGYHLDALYRSNPDRLHRPQVWNFTWYSNPQVDTWLSEGDRAVDRTVRDAAYAKVQRQVWNDAPFLWLYTEDVIVGTRGVKGVDVLPIASTIFRHAHP